MRRIKVSGLGLSLLLAAGGCTMMPPEDDPVFLKLSEIDSRVVRVERVIDNQGLMTLVNQLELLQEETRALRNQVETLEHELEQASGRQRSQYLDIDGRLEQLEQRLADGSVTVTADLGVLDGGTLPPGQLPLPGSSDRANYQAAFELLKQGRFQEANRALTQFLVSFPDSALADNAQYWLAETYYVAQQYERALAQFQLVIENFPQSGKTADALLKIGYSNYELRRWEPARRALTTVVSNYPETTAARLAAQRLEQMVAVGN
ncbi:MAG: tol-pal system protein YbgF [Chromatiales bacterium]|nr:tol-pal system protein YbgF [Chromatiales bacterium]